MSKLNVETVWVPCLGEKLLCLRGILIIRRRRVIAKHTCRYERLQFYCGPLHDVVDYSVVVDGPTDCVSNPLVSQRFNSDIHSDVVLRENWLLYDLYSYDPF